MKKPEKTNGSHALPEHTNSAGTSTMPEHFAGMYQSGYDDGYASGREIGYRKGVADAYSATHKDAPTPTAVASAFRAPSSAPRRMLVGMPCPQCGIYLLSQETHCPSCGRAKADRNRQVVAG